MDSFQKLEVWEKVNACETLEELGDVILSLADDDGMIQGRTRKFVAKKMHRGCMAFDMLPDNVLTREFGIRQQGIMLTKADYVILGS